MHGNARRRRGASRGALIRAPCAPGDLMCGRRRRFSPRKDGWPQLFGQHARLAQRGMHPVIRP
jgi:hypothetical protein